MCVDTLGVIHKQRGRFLVYLTPPPPTVVRLTHRLYGEIPTFVEET